jgi:hypothetical protein
VPAARAESPVPDRPRHDVLVLLNPQQDAFEAVSRYADYWSGRGENVGVFWMGQTGIKIALFDCARRTGWSEEILHVLNDGPLDSVPVVMRQFCDRLVAVLVTNAGWTRSPLLQACMNVCVIIEPAPYQLVGSYDSLKSLCRLAQGHALSCFAISTPSALEATRLGERFYRLGDQFLDRAIAFEGFSLAEKWPTTNRVGEAFITEKPDGRAAQLRAALLAVLRGQPAAHAEAGSTGSAGSAGAASQPAAAVVGGAGALPAVQALQPGRAIDTAAALDLFISEKIDEIAPGAMRSWPLRIQGDGLMHCRWVELDGGGRCVVVTTLGSACGALEQASAWLHPAGPNDQIIVLAPNLSSEQRRAAASLRTPTRLFELSCLPTMQPPALLLRDVSGE